MLWGVATSSYQVEGGIEHADWNAFERRLGPDFTGAGAACGHYQHALSDLTEIARLGLSAYRFSVEWSRIEPVEGRFDQTALDHYRQVVLSAREMGLEPVVTLHHFTLPEWLARQGGVLEPHFPSRLERLARLVGSALPAAWWVTINEPMVLAVMGYLTGEWPPGERSLLRTRRAVTALVEAHAAAYAVLKETGRERKVGIAKHLTPILPHRPANLVDRTGSLVQHRFFNLDFYRRTRGCHDFLGVNFYARSYARGLSGVRRSRPGEAVSQMGWVTDARDLTAVLDWLRPSGLPVLILENGLATTDERLRSAYLHSHLMALMQARRSGLPVAGYLYWTLWDNFEWREGWGPAFGLCPRPAEGARFAWRPAARLLARAAASDGEDLGSDPG